MVKKKETLIKKFTIFNHLDNLTVNKVPLDMKNSEQLKSYDPYMVNRFISMVDLYLELVNEVNLCGDIPKELHYKIYFETLPKRKHYFKYLSKKKDVNIDEKMCICEYYECGLNETEQHLTILTREQVQEIVNLYDI